MFRASPWFQHVLKATCNLSYTEQRALRQGSRQFLPRRNKLLQYPLRLVAWLGQLWPGRLLEWACQVMCSQIPPSKWQNAKPNAGCGQGTLSGSLWYLQAVPVLSLWRAGGVKNCLPLNEVFGFWAVFIQAAVCSERGLLRFALRQH